MHCMLIQWMQKNNLALQGSDQDFGAQELFVLSKQTAESGSVASIAVLVFLLP